MALVIEVEDDRFIVAKNQGFFKAIEEEFDGVVSIYRHGTKKKLDYFELKYSDDKKLIKDNFISKKLEDFFMTYVYKVRTTGIGEEFAIIKRFVETDNYYIVYFQMYGSEFFTKANKRLFEFWRLKEGSKILMMRNKEEHLVIDFERMRKGLVLGVWDEFLNYENRE